MKLLAWFSFLLALPILSDDHHRYKKYWTYLLVNGKDGSEKLVSFIIKI